MAGVSHGLVDALAAARDRALDALGPPTVTVDGDADCDALDRLSAGAVVTVTEAGADVDLRGCPDGVTVAVRGEGTTVDLRGGGDDLTVRLDAERSVARLDRTGDGHEVALSSRCRATMRGAGDDHVVRMAGHGNRVDMRETGDRQVVRCGDHHNVANLEDSGRSHQIDLGDWCNTVALGRSDGHHRVESADREGWVLVRDPAGALSTSTLVGETCTVHEIADTSRDERSTGVGLDATARAGEVADAFGARVRRDAGERSRR